METNSFRVPLRWAWLLIGICTLVRLFYAQAFLLTPDEANYWQWSRHLDWSFHDQTPLIGWVIRLATTLLGHTELGVRLPSIVAMGVASIYLVLIAERWFSAQIAWQTALLSQTVFIFNVGGILATADGLQGACWVAVSYHIACALENQGWRSWLLGGFWLGIGLLSKYTMVLMPLCVVLFALCHASHRSIFKRPQPYVACLLALCLFSPVLVWNAANNWNSIRHVAHLGGANQALTLHFNFFAEFIGSQIGLLSPLVFLLIAAGWYWVMRRGNPKGLWIYSFLVFTSLPVFVGFSLLSLHTRVYANWASTAYLNAIVLIAALWSVKARLSGGIPGTSRIWRWTVITSVLLTGFALTQTVRPILPLPLKYDRAAHEIYGWDLLGERVAGIYAQMPGDDAFIFGLNYQNASALAFYTPGQPFTVSINRWNRPNVYDYWWNDQDLIGKNGVGVLGDASSRQRLLHVFERVDAPIAVPVYRPKPLWGRTSSETLIRTYYIYPCHGFKGGLRWVPRNPGDIRVSLDR